MKHLPHVLARAVDEPKPTVFRPSYWRLFAIIGGVLHSTMLIQYLLMDRKYPVVLLVLLLAAAVCQIFLTHIFREYFRVGVSDDKVSASNYWGFHRSLTWAEIERVEPANIMGFSFWKVQSFQANKGAIYIPLFIAKQEAFREKVIAVGAPINPLRQAIENPPGNFVRARSSK